MILSGGLRGQFVKLRLRGLNGPAKERAAIGFDLRPKERQATDKPAPQRDHDRQYSKTRNRRVLRFEIAVHQNGAERRDDEADDDPENRAVDRCAEQDMPKRRVAMARADHHHRGQHEKDHDGRRDGRLDPEIHAEFGLGHCWLVFAHDACRPGGFLFISASHHAALAGDCAKDAG